MSSPRPTTQDQLCLLQCIWDLFYATNRWPTFAELEQKLDTAHEIDAESSVREMPANLLWGTGPGRVPGDTDEIGLTLAGVASVMGSQEELRLFLAAVRLAGEIYRSWVPIRADPGARPMLTAETLAQHADVPAAGRGQLLERVGKLLLTEPWGWSVGGTGPDGWQFGINRHAKQFRHVKDFQEYWDVAHPMTLSAPATPSVAAHKSAGALSTPTRGMAAPSVWDLLHPEVRRVAEPRLRNGFADNAVEEACKLIAQRLREMSGIQDDGIGLVNEAMGRNGPLRLADHSTDEGRNDHEGHANLLRGLFQVGRNPRAHRPSNDDFDVVEVFRLLSLASLAMERLTRLDSEPEFHADSIEEG